jgi:hypothetical protein
VGPVSPFRIAGDTTVRFWSATFDPRTKIVLPIAILKLN